MEYQIKDTDVLYGTRIKLMEYEVMSRPPESFCVGTLNTIVKILREEIYLLKMKYQVNKGNKG